MAQIVTGQLSCDWLELKTVISLAEISPFRLEGLKNVSVLDQVA